MRAPAHFADEEGKLNRSAAELGYSALVVSNFTLYANTKRASGPALSAAKPPLPVDAYELFFGRAGKAGPKARSGTANLGPTCRFPW